MKDDPPRRKDGKCANPNCDRPLPPRPAKRQAGIDPTVYDDEPFCSAVCCRDYHDVEAKEARRCGGCGGHVDDQTDGCHACACRHWHRARRKVAT